MHHPIHIPQSPPFLIVLLNTVVLSMTTAILIAWLGNIGHIRGIGSLITIAISIIVWTTPVVLSLTLLISTLALLSRRIAFPPLLILLIGCLHGIGWSHLMWKYFEPLIAERWSIFTSCWIGASICGILAIPVVYPPIQRWLFQHLHGDSLTFIVLVGGFLFLAQCIFMGMLWLGDGVVQHRVQSPDGRIVALVIRDDCGATCSCQMRVDLQSTTDYRSEVYRSDTACDATVTWQNAVELTVRDDSDHSGHVNIHTLGW